MKKKWGGKKHNKTKKKTTSNEGAEVGGGSPQEDRARPRLNELSGDEIGADKVADRKSG